MSLKTKKIGSLFTREISRIILEEVKNPKVKFVTITGCDITNDLSYAKVYYTALDTENKDKIIKDLSKAKGFIRSILMKRKIEMRIIPELNFVYDDSIEYGNKIESLIKEIHKKDEN